MSSNDRPGPATERGIVDRVQDVADSGDSRTPSLEMDLDRLFESHRTQIYRLCLRMARDPTRAEELTQETFTRAWNQLAEFDGDKGRFGAWIFGIARNLCRNATRKKSDLLTTDGVIEATDPVNSVLSQMRSEERSRILREAAGAVLTTIEQDAVRLRYVEQLSQGDITELLGLEGSGARGLLQRCRRKLGRELRRRLEELGHTESLFDKTI